MNGTSRMSSIEPSMSNLKLESNIQSSLNKTTSSNTSWGKSSSRKKYYLTVVSRLPNMKALNLNNQVSTLPKKRIKWWILFIQIIEWAIIFHFDLAPFPFFPFPFFFFFGFLFFIIYAWSSLMGWDTVSGSSNKNTTLFYLTSFNSFLAIPSGIQLFL